VAKSKRPARPWQLRLAPDEDNEADKLAQRRMMSKNDVLRHALRLLARLERETAAGARLLIDRNDASREQVEVWMIW
jgi:hypothetical protein